jgi:hypothetical protein
MARPPKFTPLLASEICRQVADGDTLTTVCKRLKITREVVRQWREQHPDFANSFSIAREQAADSIAEEARELLEKAKPKDMVEIALLRERVQHLRWTAKALNPRRYGERTQIDAPNVGVSLVAALQAICRPSELSPPVYDGAAEDVRITDEAA